MACCCRFAACLASPAWLCTVLKCHLARQGGQHTCRRATCPEMRRYSSDRRLKLRTVMYMYDRYTAKYSTGQMTRSTTCIQA